MSLEVDLSNFLNAYAALINNNEICHEVSMLLQVDVSTLAGMQIEIIGGDRCDECGYKLSNPEDYTYATEYETDPSPRSYEYNTGYICPECNHVGVF